MKNQDPSDILFRATLDGRVGIKKNGRRVFKNGGFAPSARYQSWERTATLSLLQQKAKTFTQLPINFPVNLKCRFYIPNHQWEHDLSNAYQGIEDILQNIGVLEDDKLIYSHDGSRKIFGANRFYIEIEITEHRLDELTLT